MKAKFKNFLTKKIFITSKSLSLDFYLVYVGANLNI